MELTEQRGIGDVVVYGYLNATTVTQARHASLLNALGDYCRRHELRLAGTFTEWNNTCPAAFIGLLDVLALPGAYGVVIPATAHLGARPVAAERRKRLVELGTKLLIVRGGRRAPVSRMEAETESPDLPATGTGS